MTVVMVIEWTEGMPVLPAPMRYEPPYRRKVRPVWPVPEPYQAGQPIPFPDPHRYLGGHEPGPCCIEKTCGWMERAMEIGHQW